MQIYYRISDTGYNKVKPDYINNENCLRNFCQHFSSCKINVIADNISDDTYNMMCKYVDASYINRVSIGHGAGTFNLALNEALKLDNNEYVYLIASLIEAVPFVSNTTGTYGAYLKKWDKRALKPLVLADHEIFDNGLVNKSFCEDANNLIKKLEGDIIYIDPPYNTGSDGFRYKDKRTLAKGWAIN